MISLEVILMYYMFGFSYLPLFIPFLITLDWHHERDIYDNDSRIAYMSQLKKFSCKEEIQRYLYHLDEYV